MPKRVLGEGVPHKSACHLPGHGFSYAPLQPPTTKHRQLCPNRDIPVQKAPNPSSLLSPSHPAGLGGRTARRPSASEVFMKEGGRGRRRGILQLLGSLRASLQPCWVSGVLAVGLSRSSGE